MVKVQTKIKNSVSEDWQHLNMLNFEVVCKMEFNSERKRMSVIVKDLQDNTYKLYSKGADSVILQRLN